jgi:hypothetical protein
VEIYGISEEEAGAGTGNTSVDLMETLSMPSSSVLGVKDDDHGKSFSL